MKCGFGVTFLPNQRSQRFYAKDFFWSGIGFVLNVAL